MTFGLAASACVGLAKLNKTIAAKVSLAKRRSPVWSNCIGLDSLTQRRVADKKSNRAGPKKEPAKPKLDRPNFVPKRQGWGNLQALR